MLIGLARIALLIFLCAALILGCGHYHIMPTGFTHTVPTIFVNSDGGTIKVSTDGLLVGGRFYRSKNCSSEYFNCFIYGEKILFITPKVCYEPPVHSWRVGKFVAQWNGYDPNSSGDVVQADYGDGVGYGFSELKGKGIDSIAYDVKGIYRVAMGERFYANIPPGRMNDMLYFSPTGPAFLPCIR